MKKIALVASAIALTISVNAQTAKKPVAKATAVSSKKAVTTVKPVMKSLIDSASYSFGQMMAANLKQGGLTTLNYDLMTKGLKDAFTSAQPALSQQKCQETINKVFEGLSKKREETDKAKFAPNIQEGDAFLLKNKSNPTVKTTASGLQYEVVKEGVGNAHPKPEDQVTVHYKGSLLNGKQFDSSYDRGEPATFGVTQVIPGWIEGLQLMTEGAKYKFYIPANLAYGARQMGNDIPPYSTLVFEVELIKINPANIQSN